MDWLEEIELYLHQRLGIQKNYQTDAIKILNRYPIVHQQMKNFVRIARDVVQMYWEMDESSKVYGKLTPTSVAIGKQCMSIVKCSKKYQDDTFVKIGDFILEGFFQCGYININVPQFKSSKPVILEPTDRWQEVIEVTNERLIRGINSKRPGKLKCIQKVQYKDGPEWNVSTVKRWGEEDEMIFNTVISHSTALSAAEKLANTGWCINRRVYDAVRKHSFKFENPSHILEHKYTMQYVEQLKDDDEFFYSTEFDYRGRVYFTMPYLNFQGSDLARGLLLFSNRKYVNESGLAWMKRHCAVSYNESYSKDSIPAYFEEDYKTHLENEGLDDISVDKMTLRDRELWVDNNWDLIVHTALNGIIHDCEKPVSFLAVCIELNEYYKTGMYFSSLPIPIDGSNNGWQHLGAISKDPLTGKLVGLEPVEIQQDFYVQTAKALISITKDEERQEILNKMPMKKIRKGISKRGSMTRAYSAGAGKIAENMYTDCKKEGLHKQYFPLDRIIESAKKEFPKALAKEAEKDYPRSNNEVWEEVHHKETMKIYNGFARDLVKAIDAVCPGPLRTMKYLQNLASSQLEAGQERLTWITPAGFPVIYECYHTRMPTIRSKIRGCNPNSDDKIGHKILLVSDAPDKRGFMCGISPNFIHSQDAAHMCMVIDRFGGNFGAVHDSFSTHANDVDELLELTKEVFVEMYSSDNYFNQIQEKLGGEASQPGLGSLDITEVNNSDYFFA